MLLDKSNVAVNGKQGLVFTLRGDKEILPLLNLKLQMTIIVQKPFVACIPITPLFLQSDTKPSQAILDPLIGIQVFGQPQIEYFTRSRPVIKENILYIYFPSNIYVDQKVNKIYQNSYQNLSKEIPKNFRNNFVKLILFQTGNGDNSVDQQRSRCSDALSYLFKLSLQKKVEQCVTEINSISISQLKPSNLANIFRNKSKLAYIYRNIGLDQKAQQILALLWQDILYNQRCFSRETESKVTYLPPYIQRNYFQIIKQFSSPNGYLRICTFCFFKIFELQLQLMNYCDAMKKLRHFIEFAVSNIFAIMRVKPQIIKHLWVVSLIDEAYETMNKLGRAHPTFLNPQKEDEYQGYTVAVARIYRNSLQILGAFLYNFDRLVFYPRTIQFQVDYSLNQLSLSERKLTSQPTSETVLINDKIEDNLLLLFGGFQPFKWLYLKSLINQYDYLNRSTKYKRMARSVKLNMLKTYLSIVQPDNLKFSSSYLSEYSANGSDVYEYIDKIMKKADKISTYDQEDAYINDALFKKSVKYEPQRDNFINRNRQDQIFWSLLKFIEDYYNFILLLIAHRSKSKEDRPHDQSMLSLSFSRISHKYPVKTDNVIHLLLNEELMKLKIQWSVTTTLVREIFLRERSEQSKIDDESLVNIRMGILVDVDFNQDSESTLLIKVNNQQLLNLIHVSDNQLISLELSIVDVNKKSKVIKTQLITIKIIQDNYLQLELAIMTQQCLIFIIKQLEVKIGLMVCYYVNRNFELHELAEIEEEGRLKKSRKYSSFEEKLREEEFTHMINKSEHLTLNFINYHTVKLECDYHNCEIKARENPSRTSSSIVNRERSSSAASNRERNSSMSSTLIGFIKDKSVTVSLYLDVWTPVVFKIKPIFSGQSYRIGMPLNKILVGLGDMQQVSDWLKINKTWVNKSKSEVFQLQVGTEGINLMLMIRGRGGKQMIKSTLHARKGSIAMSHSAFSNASWQRGESLRVQMQIKQDEYSYLIETAISYSRNKPIEVKYIYCEQLQEYTIQNITNRLIKVFTSNQRQIFTHLKQGEEIKLQSEHVSLEIDTETPKQPHQAVSLQENPSFASPINLQQYVKKELLKPYKLETVQLFVCKQGKNDVAVFKKLELVKIKSEQAGLLSIIDPGKGFELVGRVQGELRLFPDGTLDLYLIPVTTGKLILPSLLIGGKKGLWKQSIFITVVQ